MNLKQAAFFAWIGMALLTLLYAVSFIRDFSAFLGDAIALAELVKTGVLLLASLSVAVFLFVFHKNQQ